MQELIARIAKNVGIDQDLAMKAVGIIMQFLSEAAPGDKVGALLDALPGAREFLEAQGGGGSFGGMMGAIAAANEMTEAGLDLSQVQDVTKETIKYAREKAGEETVNNIVASIPGLSQFI